MPTYRYYLVTFTFQFPAHNEREPATERVQARTAAEANRDVRRTLRDRGYLAVDTGRINCTARLDADQSTRDDCA